MQQNSRQRAEEEIELKIRQEYRGYSEANIQKLIRAEIFQRCAKDYLFFIKNYCSVPHQKYGTILMGDYTFPKQEQLLHLVHSEQFVITNKCRQTGISTILGLYALWMALFNINKEVCIVSITDKDSKKFKRRYVDYPYERLPDFLRSPVKSSGAKKQLHNKHEIEFYTGSIISCESGSNAGRGGTYALLILDEAGFVMNAEETWASAFPTLNVGGGHAVVNSTSSAIGTWYATQWFDTINGLDSVFKPFEIDWFDVPYFKGDPQFLERQRKAIKPESKFRREILREFVIDGEHYIGAAYIQAIKPADPLRSDFILSEDNPTDVDEVLALPENGVDDGRNYYKGLWFWEEPSKKHQYIISCDVAEGSGTDYSTLEVIDTTTNEQVCEYKGKIDTFSFAKLIFKIGHYFNEALIVVEYNSMGNAVFNKLHQDLKYENLYWRPDGKMGSKPGWHTSTTNRPDVLQSLYKTVTERTIKLNSKRLRDELQNLVTIKNKVQAALGTNDDIAMAFAIGTHLMGEVAMFSGYYDTIIDIENEDPDSLMDQTPESIKEYLQQQTEYELDNQDFKQYSWVM